MKICGIYVLYESKSIVKSRINFCQGICIESCKMVSMVVEVIWINNHVLINKENFMNYFSLKIILRSTYAIYMKQRSLQNFE